jgi:tetratricopeptide (TPR) repeat protein
MIREHSQLGALAWAQLAEGGSASAWWLLALIPLAALGVLAGFAVYRRFWDPRGLETAARRAREKGQTGQAIAWYARLIRRQAACEGKRQPPRQAAEYVLIFRRARVALGELYLEGGDRSAAVHQFMAARKLGAKLSVEALTLLAEYYAERSDRGPDAVEAYLRYAAARPPAGPADKVYRALQAACAVEETSDAATRRTAMALNRRVLKVRAGIEWAHYYLGLAHLIAGEIPAAAEAFEAARKLNPGRALTCYWLGACRLQQTPPDVDGALEVLSKFLAASTTNQKFLRRQERAALELGRKLVSRAGGFDSASQALGEAQHADLRKATEYFQYAVTKNPASQEGHFYLGRTWSWRGDSERAIAALETAVRLAGEREPRKPACSLKRCLYYLGAEQWRTGALEAAAASLGRATEVDPDFAEAHALAAAVHLRRQDYQRAESHARTGLRLRGSAPGLLACLLQALFHQGRFREVAAELDAAPEPSFPGEELPAVSLAAGRSYLWAGQFEKAVRWLGSLDGDPRADYHLGCALAHCGRYEEALERFARVEAAGGENAARARLQRAHVLLRRGETEAAEAAYLAVEAAEPGCADALYALGCLYSGRGEIDPAAGYLARLLEVEPASARVRLALGGIEERRGNAAEAIGHYTAALEAGADAAAAAKVRVRLGVLYVRRGDYRRAVEALEEASRLGEQGDALLFYLGLARLQSERSVEAVPLWSRLAERHPEDEQLAANLARARYLAGAYYAARGDYEAAIAEWERYLQRCGEDAQTSQNLSRLYYTRALQQLGRGEQADLERAQEWLAKALERDAGARDFHYHFALCDLGLRRYAECQARLEQLARDREEPHVLYHLGLCLLRQGESGQALEIFRRLARRPCETVYAERASCLAGDQFASEARYEMAAGLLSQGLGMPPGALLT